MTINAQWVYDQQTSPTLKSAWVVLFDDVAVTYRKYEESGLPRETDSAAWLAQNRTAQEMWNGGESLTGLELRFLGLLRDAEAAHTQIDGTLDDNTARLAAAQASSAILNPTSGTPTNAQVLTAVRGLLAREIGACNREDQRLKREHEIIYTLERLIRQSLV